MMSVAEVRSRLFGLRPVVEEPRVVVDVGDEVVDVDELVVAFAAFWGSFRRLARMAKGIEAVGGPTIAQEARLAFLEAVIEVLAADGPMLPGVGEVS